MSLLSRFLLFLIRVYQYTVSPFTGRSCRYHPTCSSYTATAIRRFGALRGSVLGAKRICRCHPYNPGGYDPVPATKEDATP
ncbi:MAG: membrane protein insertion efficiency factor YidD [Alphaproteobacteria bacterium]|nr:membrane protein insertion efficiency factor YidD [Alphaproteobacteria bacterium]MDE2335810.1 membrane protein insertion efficiency factor YidD [Alphaproteobacteria bacterium]